MLGDDVGYGDLAAFGGHPYARTPNLDRLFKEGTSLRQYYVVGCTCAPSRAALMSGRHPATFEFRLGLGLAAVGTPALTEVFGAAGYAVAHFGKWHLGPERPYYAARRADDGSTHLGIHTVVSSGKELPCALPEEERRGKARRYTGRGRDEAVYYAAERWVERHAARPWYANVWGHSTHDPVFNCDLLTAERGLDTDWLPQTFDLARFSEHMASRLRHAASLGIQIDVTMKKYLTDLYSLDLNIGSLLATIDRLHLRESTLVLFSSDHGPAVVSKGPQLPRGARRRMEALPPAARPPLTFAGESPFLMGYAGGLRGGKFTQYDGGVRVPLLVRWPGVVQAGHVDSDSVVSALDLLPTVADLAGLTPLLRAMTPPGARQDGEAMSAVFTARAARDRTAERPIFWKGGYGARQRRDKNVISVRSGKWKLHVIPVVKHVGSWEHTDARVTPAHGTPEPAAESAHKLRNSARQRQQRLQMYIERHGNSSGPMLELYNLKTDAEEMVELSAEQPRVVQRLLELVRQWNQSLASTRTSSLTSAEESPSMPMGRRLARKAKRVKLKRQAGHPTGNKSRKDADCWEIAYGPRPGEVPNASPPPPWL